MFRGFSGSSSPVTARHKRFLPTLEALESRLTPATLTVTSPANGDAVGTLRYEVGVAETGDTIVFSNTLAGQTITLNSAIDVGNNGVTNLTIKGRVSMGRFSTSPSPATARIASSTSLREATRSASSR